MVRGFTVVVFVMCFVSISSVHAGTWRDDFEDGNLDGWGIVNLIPAEKWAVEDGECSGQFRANDPANEVSVLDLKIENFASWKDYNVACRAKLVEKLGQNPTFGIWFRDDTVVFGYNALIYLDDKTVAMQGADQRFLKVPLPFDISEDIWYKLEVIAEGEHFEFYIDDELVGSFGDDSLPSGTVGLSVGNTHVHFDDVVITGPEIPDGGPGFAVTSQSKLATTWGSVKRCP